MIDPNRMTHKLQEALQQAGGITTRRNHQGIDVEHLFLALVDQDGGLASSLLEAAGVALRQDSRATAAVDRAVDTATTQQGAIRGIHDRVDVFQRQIAAHQVEPRATEDAFRHRLTFLADAGRVANPRGSG